METLAGSSYQEQSSFFDFPTDLAMMQPLSAPPVRFAIAFTFGKDARAMDYETKDLTGKPDSHYGEIRLSQTKNPRALNESAWKNMRELADIVDDVLIRGKNPQALTHFFNASNKGDNIRNVMAAGSELGNGSEHLTSRIESIGRKIIDYVGMDVKFPGTFPQAQTLHAIWEQNRGQIPDMQDIVKKTQIKVASIDPAIKASSSSQQASSAENRRNGSLVLQPLG